MATWPAPAAQRLPPPGPIRAFAEYESNEGLLFRWESASQTLIGQMIAGMHQGDADVLAYVAISAATNQASLRTQLVNAGADGARVRFIVASTDSVWMRDYGPRFVEARGQRVIIDHQYNRPRPNDDRFPEVLASLWGLARYDIGLRHGGGNYHLYANGEAFATDLLVNENAPFGLDAAQIRARYADYQGNALDLSGALPASFDSTQHIDMWLLPVAETRAIVSEYPTSPMTLYGTPRAVTEAMASELSGRGIEVFRTPGWSAQGTHYTYANAVVINRQVLMCSFNGYAAQNAQALEVFGQAFPGYRLVQVDCTSIITRAGSLHCIVMHVPDRIYRDGADAL